MQKKSGFTLIELLIVIAIIGILGGMLAPKLFGAMHGAKEQHCRKGEEGASRCQGLAPFLFFGFAPCSCRFCICCCFFQFFQNSAFGVVRITNERAGSR